MSLRQFAGYVSVLCLLVVSLNAEQATPPQSNLTTTSAPASVTPPATSTATSATPAAVPAVPAARSPRAIPVLLSATDAHGAPVLSLTKEQLTILDTNQEVEAVKLYKGPDLPLHLGIVLVCNSQTFAQQRAAAIDLVNKVIRPGVDEAFVVTAHCKKPWASDRLDWRQDPAELSKIIQGLDPNAGLWDSFDFEFQTDETGIGARNSLQTFGGNGVTVFDVAYSMMSSDPRPSRRVLFMFREPWAHSPGFGRRANTAVEAHLLRVIAAAQAMHISTYVIGLEDQRFNGLADNNIGKTYISRYAGDNGGAGEETRAYDVELEKERYRAYEEGRANVTRLATETGGAVYWSTKKNYPDAVTSIANQLAGQYIVTFVPKDAPTDAHPLKITAKDGSHILAQPVFLTATH
jgi:VWFA-related protein